MNNDRRNPENEHRRAAPKPVARPSSGARDRQEPTATRAPDDIQDGLPLLEDVVEPDDPVFRAWNAERARSRAQVKHPARHPRQSSPDFEQDILAYKLKTDLADGLEEMVRTVVSSAIERSRRDLEKTLHTELAESLESRLEEVLSRLSEDQPPKP